MVQRGDSRGRSELTTARDLNINSRERRTARGLISAGTKNFHLIMTAEEMASRNRLAGLVCGPYPKGLARALGRVIAGRRGQRFLSRELNIPTNLVRPIWLAEGVQDVAFALRRIRGDATKPSILDQATLSYYHQAACRIVKDLAKPGDIYHFRAAFGGPSVALAKRRGMFALCDHSLADPRLLPSLVSGERHTVETEFDDLDLVSRAMCRDLNFADAILANSDFVKETLVACGCDPERVHVIYLGVDDAFVDLLPDPDSLRPRNLTQVEFLFAGFFSYRKGADTLLRALEILGPGGWRLTVAGQVDPRIRQEFGSALDRPEINIRGVVDRTSLAGLMAASDALVFPSRAEGSARVIFEAMAAGCAVITTRESGSIVVDGKNGFMIKANDSMGLAAVLRRALPTATSLRAIGVANRELVLSSYRQRHYGDRLTALYDDFAERKRCLQ